MSRKRIPDESMSGDEEVKRIDAKHESLKENYDELQRSFRSWKQKTRREKDKEKLLEAEVRFLQHKYQMFTEKDHEDPAADEPASHELTRQQPLMSTTHYTSPEMVVTHALEQANKKRDLENNGLVSAQKPSKVKDGRKKKIKEDLLVSRDCGAKSIIISKIPSEAAEALAIEDMSRRHAQKPSKVKDGRKKKIKKDLLVSPDCGAKSIIVSKIPSEPAEALAIEDKCRRHELTRMQTFSSTNDCTFPEMVQTSSFKVPHRSLVTTAVIGGRNEKIKADALVSLKISRRPREPTVGLGIEDEPARHELMGMQPLSSIDDLTVPEMIELQPTTIRKMSDFKVPHGSLVTPTVKPTNKKRRLENNAQTSVQKPSNVKDSRNRKIKADPLVSPKFVARNISVSGRPREPMEALAIEGETSRYEFTGMQPLLPTADYISSDMGILTTIPVPQRSLATPNVEDGPARHELLDLFRSSEACTSAEMTGRQRSGARTMSAITKLQSLLVTQPARHELQLFSPSDACTSTEVAGGLQGSSTRTMPVIANLQSSLVTPFVRPAIANLQSSLVTPVVRPAIANLQSSLGTPIVKPAIEKRLLENNGLVSDQKPSKVKGSRRKNIKDNSQMSKTHLTFRGKC